MTQYDILAGDLYLLSKKYSVRSKFWTVTHGSFQGEFTSPPPSDTPYLCRKITGENATVSFSGHFRSSFIQDYIFFSRQIFGVVRNTGRRVIFSVDRSSPPVRIYGGPLSYRYLLHEIEIKFGGDDSHGSEHTVNGKAFPLEVRSQFARTYEAALLEHLK